MDGVLMAKVDLKKRDTLPFSFSFFGSGCFEKSSQCDLIVCFGSF